MLYQRMYSLAGPPVPPCEKPDVVEQLFLEVSEEVLHHCVVVAVALAGHRLDRAGTLQKRPPGGVVVLESLVRILERLLTMLETGEGVAQ